MTQEVLVRKIGESEVSIIFISSIVTVEFYLFNYSSMQCSFVLIHYYGLVLEFHTSNL